jgi:hypothetical protein
MSQYETKCIVLSDNGSIFIAVLFSPWPLMTLVDVRRKMANLPMYWRDLYGYINISTYYDPLMKCEQLQLQPLPRVKLTWSLVNGTNCWTGGTLYALCDGAMWDIVIKL